MELLWQTRSSTTWSACYWKDKRELLTRSEIKEIVRKEGRAILSTCWSTLPPNLELICSRACWLDIYESNRKEVSIIGPQTGDVNDETKDYTVWLTSTNLGVHSLPTSSSEDNNVELVAARWTSLQIVKLFQWRQQCWPGGCKTDFSTSCQTRRNETVEDTKLTYVVICPLVLSCDKYKLITGLSLGSLVDPTCKSNACDGESTSLSFTLPMN